MHTNRVSRVHSCVCQNVSSHGSGNDGGLEEPPVKYTEHEKASRQQRTAVSCAHKKAPRKH